MDLLSEFKERAKARPKRIVFPEGEDERVIAAASKAAEEGIAEVIVLRADEKGGELPSSVKVVQPKSSPELKRYAEIYHQRRPKISPKVAERILKRPLLFGAMMVSVGDADGFVGGAANPTARVIEAAGLTIGYAEGISTPSSFFIMVVGEKVLIYADAAVNVAPTPRQLAEIAVASGRTARLLLDMEPRVALLSFSTKGSASHELVDKVVEATKIAKELAPDMLIDGELQADAALVPEIAERKVKESPVAGRANVLIFPDLNSGNIAYKLTQHLAGARAIGPFLQGFAKPVSDLSRGASVDDIVDVTSVVVVEAQGLER